MSEALQLYEELIKKIKTYHPSKDFTMVEEAYKIAFEAHGAQTRFSGEPYIIHPLCVAHILADLELDLESIVSGILHDIIEDTEYTFEDIEKMFSEEIANLVDGVTKLGKISYSSKEEVQVENYRKMFLAMAKDIRVILIKLADRLHNMRTLNFMRPEKQREKAQETLDIYAPLAHRLGISKICSELEDLSLKYLEPEAYYDLAHKIHKKQSEREAYVSQITISIKEQMAAAGIEGSVEGRPKHFFSIYKKMHNQAKSMDQIYDLFAVRIIVDTVKDCYAVLGIIHDIYVPMPGRFKDYIAMPKPNMYQSIHNTLIGPGGEPFEMQIRTKDMHRTAEYGIAAHWKYKEGKGGKTTDQEEAKLTWLRQILEWQRDLSDNKEFMQELKRDLNIYNDQVHAFTPKGDVISLPQGSTPLDFAYAVHSAVGNKMVGARVNGRIVTIDYQIKNGDRVEVITSQNSRGPSRDWLKIVKSSQARSKIKQWFKREFKEENILRGKELFEKEVKKKGYHVHELMKPEWVETVTKKYGFGNWDALLAAIGHGGVKEGYVVNRLREEMLKEQSKNMEPEELLQQVKAKTSNNTKNKGIVTVKGVGDIPVRLSRCCNPVPGDEIVGFVTRGRGVSIHRTDCVNIVNVSVDDRERLMEVEWDDHIEDMKASFPAEIKISADDRNGMLMDISAVLTEGNIHVKSLNARTLKGGVAIFNVTIDILDKQQLEALCNKMMGLPGVYDIERFTS